MYDLNQPCDFISVDINDTFSYSMMKFFLYILDYNSQKGGFPSMVFLEKLHNCSREMDSPLDGV